MPCCCPSGLSEYRPLPGNAIPYHLTDAEAQAFLTEHEGNRGLESYLVTKLPAYGIIVHPDPPAIGDFLVWIDASDVLHVVDVTMMPIAKAVEQPEFYSPAPTASDVLGDVKNLVDTLLGSLKYLGIAAGVLLALYAINSMRSVRP